MEALPLCEDREGIGSPAGVDFVTQDRVMHGGHVDADLMGPAGLEDTFHVRVVPEAFQDAYVRHSGLPGGVHGHLLAVLRVPADRAVDRELLLPDPVMDDRQVLPADAVFLELRRDGGVGRVVLADDERACRVAVDAVHDAGPQDAVDPGQGAGPGLRIQAVMHDGVHERAVPVARRGVNDHALGLIYDEDVVVLIEDVERDIFGRDVRQDALRKADRDQVALLHLVRGLCGLPAAQDVLILDQVLEIAA